jgi:hypothetical protein
MVNKYLPLGLLAPMIIAIIYGVLDYLVSED